MLDEKGFDLWADGYDKTVGLSDEDGSYPFAGYREILNRIYRTVMEKLHPDVLDIGFGTGTITAKLYGQGCRIYGQDFSRQMIALAQKKMPEAHLYHGDFSDGLVDELKERSYDFILATYSLHHLDDERKVSFLQELRSQLKAGGMILIGDVAFETRRELEACRRQYAEIWDEDEIYFVHEELNEKLPQLEFMPVSFCAGILRLGKGDNNET